MTDANTDNVMKNHPFQIDEDVDWKLIKPDIFAAIMDFFVSGLPVVTEDQAPADTGKLVFQSQIGLSTLISNIVKFIKILVWSNSIVCNLNIL